MSGRVKNLLKNTVIVILLLSLVALTVLTWFGDMQPGGAQRQEVLSELFGGIFSGTGDAERGLYSGYREYDYTMSILSPVRAAVRSGGALSCFTARDAVRELFERTSALLADALASADGRNTLSAYQWRQVLRQDLICFDFEGDMPLAMLSAVIGLAETNVAEQQARAIVLYESGDALILVIRPREGMPIAYATAVAAGEFDALLGEYGEGNARFAFEDPISAQYLPDEFIVMPNRAVPKVLKRTAPLSDYTGTASERLIYALLSGFGCNPYTTGAYIDSDGTRVYVEEFRTLRITPDGALSYYAPEPVDDSVPVTERSAIISSAATMLDHLASNYIGDASIFISRAYYDTDAGRYIILFGCAVDGIPLILEDGYFARLEYVGSSLVGAHMTVAGYIQTESQEALLPDVQAAAAAGKSRIFELRYGKHQDGEYRANWYFVK